MSHCIEFHKQGEKAIRVLRTCFPSFLILKQQQMLRSYHFQSTVYCILLMKLVLQKKCCQVPLIPTPQWLQ